MKAEALARLKAFDPLASVVLDASGLPRSAWWPIAFALQRLEDPRAKPALLAGGRVIISTGTKTLQDQLFHRDLPQVRAALGVR